MKKYIILLCVLVSNVLVYGSFKGGTQWQLNGLKVIVLLGDKNFAERFPKIIKTVVARSNSITLILNRLRYAEGENPVDGIGNSPGFDKDLSPIMFILQQSIIFNKKRVLPIKLGSYSEKKNDLDKDLIALLNKVKIFWGSQSQNNIDQDFCNTRKVRIDEVIEGFSRRKGNNKNFFEDSVNVKRNSEKIQQTTILFVPLYQELTFYLEGLVYERILRDEGQGKYIFLTVDNKMRFFAINQLFAYSKKNMDLKKSFFSGKSGVKKDYFKNISIESLPTDNKPYTMKEVKLLCDVPLTWWEMIKYQASVWKKYLIPTAIVGAGLLGGAYWWNKRKAAPSHIAPSPIKIKSNDTTEQFWNNQDYLHVD